MAHFCSSLIEKKYSRESIFSGAEAHDTQGDSRGTGTMQPGEKKTHCCL